MDSSKTRRVVFEVVVMRRYYDPKAAHGFNDVRSGAQPTHPAPYRHATHAGAVPRHPDPAVIGVERPAAVVVGEASPRGPRKPRTTRRGAVRASGPERRDDAD